MSSTSSHYSYSLQKFLQDCNRDFFDANATVQKGLEKLGLRDLEDTLPGMELPLMPHQILGVAFMLDRERSSFKGGILADEMGVSHSLTLCARHSTNKWIARQDGAGNRHNDAESRRRPDHEN